MDKKYTLKSWLFSYFILLISCSAIGQRTNIIVGKQVSTTNAKSELVKKSNQSVFYTTNPSVNQNFQSIARQSSGTSSSLLAVCDINQSSFDFPDSGTSFIFGQSFTAQCNSNIASVSLTIGSTFPTAAITVDVYLGETVSGSSLGSATLASGVTGENTFVFSAPIAITSGQIYTMIYTSSTLFTVPISSSDPYIDGNATDGVSFSSGFDLVFKVTTCDTPITPTFTPISPICAGHPLAALPTTSINGVTGLWSPAINNTTTTIYTFTPDISQCASTTTLTIIVNPTTPNTTTIIACDSYIWPVNGTTYTTSGNYTQVTSCNTETLILSIIPIQTVNIATPGLACETNTLTLTATTSAAQINGYTGVFNNDNWTLINTNADGSVNTNGAPSSIKLTGGNNSSANLGDTDYTIKDIPFTGTISFNWDYSSSDLPLFDVPNLIIDGNPTLFTGYNISGSTNQSGTMTVNVTIGQTIGFNIHTIDNLFGSATIILYNFTATIAPQLQWVASNGGTIVGAANQLNVNVTTSGTYTLTNTIGVCSSSDFVAVTFNPNLIPTFTQVNPICSGDTLSALPTTSDNGFTGTWLPALNNSNTTLYTFTPDSNQCATTATMTITVNPSSSNATYVTACETYTWPENSTTYTVSGIYTSVTGCHTEILELTIIPINTITIAPPSIACENNTLTLTATTSTVQFNNFIDGYAISNWTFSNTNADGSLNTLGAPNSIALTGGDNGSVDIGNTNYTITIPASGTISFNWDYSTVDDPIFDFPNIIIDGIPTVFSGYNLFGSSNQSGSMTVNVLAGQTFSFNVFTDDNLFGAASIVISNFIAISLPNLQWTATNGGTIVGVDNLLNVDVTSSGTYTISASDGLCQTFSDFVDVTFNPIETPIFTQVDPICAGDTLAALPTTSDNSITGTWLPALDNTTTTLYTFTPDSTQCATTAFMTIIINTSSTNGSVTTSICSGDSYTWPANGVTYTTAQSGVTVVTSCNTATLNLTIKNTTSHTTDATACDTYTWSAPLGDGNTYTTSQTGLTNTSTNADGCPHVETLNLTINNSTSNTTDATACDTYTWAAPLGDGNTYTTSQTGLIHTSTNAAGCTHTETLNLIITPSTPNTTVVSECDSYTWAENGTTYTASGLYSSVTGCHTEFLDLTITPSSTNTIVIAECDTYTWAENGTTYTVSGMYSSVNGCHTEFLDLTITPSTSNTTFVTACDSYTWAENGTTYSASEVFFTITGCHTEILDLTIITAIVPTGNPTQTIAVNNANDATLASIIISPINVVWYGSLLDAQTETNPLSPSTVLITGATYFAVNVVGTCISAPFAVTVTVALENEEFDNLHFSYYPNPTTSLLNIKYSKEISGVSVFNLLGQLLMEKKTNSTEVQIDLLNLPSATYFVKVTSEGVEKIIKVIKQ